MLPGPIKELYYSNGVDVFGPVNLDEFCKNRYYESTLVWYAGLHGWVDIGDCDELKHLIGTMSTDDTNNGIPRDMNSIAPPLNKRQNVKSGGNTKNVTIILLILAVMVSIVAYFLKDFNSTQITPGSITHSDTLVRDSSAMKEAEMVKNASLESEKKTYRLNWEKFILALPNDFKQKEIGGIANLKVILKNNSPYALDSVKVKVVFIKVNGDTYQTENLQFDNVPPKGAKELFAPQSNRGVKVDCSIIAVYSNSMNLCFDKREKNFAKKTGTDPHKCN